MTKKILLPSNKKEREYVIYLYKNRNNFHNMKSKDIDNLIKLMAYGKLEKADYPKIEKEKSCNPNGLCFSKFKNNFSSLF